MVRLCNIAGAAVADDGRHPLPSFGKPANDAPPQISDYEAYMAQLDAIEQAAWKVAHDVGPGTEPEVGDVLRAACMMLHAAYVDRAKLLAMPSAGHFRVNATDWSRVGAARKDAL
jgi:hypothetical protein